MRREWVMTLAGASAVMLSTCGSDAVTMIGDAMVDAGEMLSDAGDAMLSDANAGTSTVLELACNEEMTRSVSYADGNATTTTFWYASATVPGLVPNDTDLRYVACDREDFAFRDPPLPGGDCPEGGTCSGPLLPPPGLRCQSFSGAELDDGRFRIFCGNRQELIQVLASTGERIRTVYGSRWSRIHVVIE